MFKKATTIAKGLALLAVLVLVFAQLNSWVFHFKLWGSETRTTITTNGPTTVTKIEPIVLDCRARVTVHVPVSGAKYYRVHVLGLTKTYRDDEVWLAAVGDVDICVRGGANVQELKTGGWVVTIPAKAIVFERPRVDQTATMNSVGYDKGWFGKLTDTAPWVSDNNHMVPTAMAFAQSIIAGSNCMSAAWNPVTTAIKEAYRQQATAKHIDPQRVQVVFDGSPDFRQHDGDSKQIKLKGYTLKADMRRLKCQVQPHALTAKQGR